MLNILVALFGVGLVMLLGETLWRLNITSGEYARKFIHIVTSMFAASWAFFMDYNTIALISIILVGVVILVNKYNIFSSVQSIKRTTYGEIWYPLGIGVSAVIFQDPAIYALAVLNMGVADGMAAVVGVSLGKYAKAFSIFGSTKSFAGTATFVIISFAMYVMYWLYFSNVQVFGGDYLVLGVVSLVSASIVALVEMIAPRGSDNILVPIVAGIFAVLPTLHLIL